jgi:hypothetical protein
MNLKFQTQAKVSSFKNPHIKIDLLNGGQNPLSYYVMNLNTISLPWWARPIKECPEIKHKHLHATLRSMVQRPWKWVLQGWCNNTS